MTDINFLVCIRRMQTLLDRHEINPRHSDVELARLYAEVQALAIGFASK